MRWPGQLYTCQSNLIWIKMMKQLIQGSINKELKEDNIINADQHEFIESRSCWANLMAFIEEITNLDGSDSCVGLAILSTFWWTFKKTRMMKSQHQVYIIAQKCS